MERFQNAYQGVNFQMDGSKQAGQADALWDDGILLLPSNHHTYDTRQGFVAKIEKLLLTTSCFYLTTYHSQVFSSRQNLTFIINNILYSFWDMLYNIQEKHKKVLTNACDSDSQSYTLIQLSVGGVSVYENLLLTHWHSEEQDGGSATESATCLSRRMWENFAPKTWLKMHLCAECGIGCELC